MKKKKVERRKEKKRKVPGNGFRRFFYDNIIISYDILFEENTDALGYLEYHSETKNKKLACCFGHCV